MALLGVAAIAFVMCRHTLEIGGVVRCSGALVATVLGVGTQRLRRRCVEPNFFLLTCTG